MQRRNAASSDARPWQDVSQGLRLGLSDAPASDSEATDGVAAEPPAFMAGDAGRGCEAATAEVREFRRRRKVTY
jgi:hypothetical protein